MKKSLSDQLSLDLPTKSLNSIDATGDFTDRDLALRRLHELKTQHVLRQIKKEQKIEKKNTPWLNIRISTTDIVSILIITGIALILLGWIKTK